MLKCVHNECQWPECDKTCGLAPEGDYILGTSPEEPLIYHLQKRVEELLKANKELKQQFTVARSIVNKLDQSLMVLPETEEACIKACKFGFYDCIHNPEYIRRNYPDWWVDLGMPTECSH